MTVLLVVITSIAVRAEDAATAFDVPARSATCTELFFTPPALPPPRAVVIDRARARVLFAMSAHDGLMHRLPPADPDVTTPPIEQTWQNTIEHANRLARAETPPETAWFDVTDAWPAVNRLFVAYRRHLEIGIANEDCYDFAARWNGVEPIAGGAREVHYLNSGFVETTATDAEVGFVTVRSRSGVYVTTHAFVPIPGTDWVVHKQGTAPIAGLIAPLDEVLEQYGTLNRNQTVVRYFRRATPGQPVG